jgi:hypothetical protein
MRRWMVIAAGVGIGLTSAAAAWADSARPSPQLLVLSQRPGAPAAPTILRGSAVQPKAVETVETTSDSTQIVAGQQLWLVDRATGEVQSCVNLQTVNVGFREIRCTTAEFGGYSRTFGRNFRP